METFSAVLAICAGNSPVPDEFPAQRPVTRSFDVFSDLQLNKRLSKQWWGWWFKTPSRSSWPHCNDSERPQVLEYIYIYTYIYIIHHAHKDTFGLLRSTFLGSGEYPHPRTQASDTQLWCFFLICAWINRWVNNRGAGYLIRYRAHYDVIVIMGCICLPFNCCLSSSLNINDYWIPFTTFNVIWYNIDFSVQATSLLTHYSITVSAGNTLLSPYAFIKMLCVSKVLFK